MKILSTLFLPGLALLTATAPGLRADFNPAMVPADSKWVAYADFDALRETELGKILLQRLPVSIDVGEDGGSVKPDLNKIMTTIGSVTAFGDSLSGQHAEMNGAMIIQGTSDLRKIAEGLVAHMTLTNPDQFRELPDLPFEAYQVHGEIVVGFPTEPIVVVGRSPAKLTEALAVYRGRGASLKGGNHALSSLLPTKSGYYLYGATLVPSEHLEENAKSPQARILQMTQAAAVSVSENEDLATVQATLVAGSSDVADKLIKILNGLTAMLSLAETNDADVATLLNSLQVGRDGRQVTAELSYSTARLVALMDQHVNNAVESHPQRDTESAAAPARQLDVEGDLLATWTADADLGADGPSANNFAIFTSEPVPLRAGERLIVTSARERGEHARIDYLELIPVDNPGGKQRLEGEYLRLNNYRIEASSAASGGELIRIDDGRGTAELRVPGPAGSYRIRVCYIDENDGTATFHLSTVSPEQ
ncbi:hypothetical protein [Synoicihabitans lomoniglobus]|uniref:Uncharacterized protein n=1 Tax=Synoicihabitans lomoniglobus TaxID=2909285 RepID=A0AAF0CN85_9BACT|nr:hypothetical protein [Opitutaceae bacterium LMO-M01]WED65178.1 hypothetical protein PXH66_22805 [Opitutaceae bacterium LMO-M01]